jgi:hypothetical protein
MTRMSHGFVAAVALAAYGCALTPGGSPAQPTSVWIRSHNRSAVDVYVLCGSSDALWLGAVAVRGADAFEIPARQRDCVRGLNFFLVVRSAGRGYWVGPFRPRRAESVDLVIEKYAGLSSARVRYDQH